VRGVAVAPADVVTAALAGPIDGEDSEDSFEDDCMSKRPAKQAKHEHAPYEPIITPSVFGSFDGVVGDSGPELVIDVSHDVPAIEA